MTSMGEHARVPRALKKWQAGLIAGAVLLLTIALLAAAAASSYDNLWHLAAAYGVPMPRLNPVELDGGLVVIALIDMALTWCGYPLGGLRFLARILGAGTIAANVAAGWPHPVGAFLRAFAPAIIVAITEAVRAFLLARNPVIQTARNRKRDRRVPVARWLLAPWPTFILWRRMRLWDISDYRAAVDMEVSRRQAIVQLEMKYGAEWKSLAPADLVWMLRAGVRMCEALERVAALVASALPVAEAVPGSGPGTGPGYRKRERPAVTGNRKRAPGNANRKQAPVPAPATGPAGEVAPDDLDNEAKVLWYVANGESASAAGVKAGLTDSRGRQIVRDYKRLSAPAPKDIVDGKEDQS